jgi:hypothetical protein
MELFMSDLIDFRADELEDIGWGGEDGGALLRASVALASRSERQVPDWYGGWSNVAVGGTNAGNGGVDEAAAGMREMAIDDRL